MLRRLLLLLGFAAAIGAARLRAEERNAWPIWVGQDDAAGRAQSWNALGPLFFSQPAADGARWSGFRPFYVRRSVGGATTEGYFLYPIVTYRRYGDQYVWSVFDLINRHDRTGVAPPPPGGSSFDIWPIYFSRDTGLPATSYRAVFPIAGTVQGRLGYDRIGWTLFPFYARLEKNGAVTTEAPWPILRSIRGTERGFALWPLFGWKEKPGVFRREFYLWPLGWNNTLRDDAAPAGAPPLREIGVLPFYSSEIGPGLESRTYLWPFFGFTHRSAPNEPYDETRTFWPFFVQGRGPGREVNRWGPFYTHSTIKGFDKTWVLWPVWRQQRWNESGVAQTKTQFLYVVYWSVRQRSLANPSAPPASKTHLWPLFSSWDNGAGRRQFEALSPLEAFFPENEPVRRIWTPLFALFRYESRPQAARWSLLWNAVTWRRDDAAGSREFHLGPVLGVQSGPAGRRIAIGGGLFGFRRRAGESGWHPFWMEFPPKSPSVPPANR